MPIIISLLSFISLNTSAFRFSRYVSFYRLTEPPERMDGPTNTSPVLKLNHSVVSNDFSGRILSLCTFCDTAYWHQPTPIAAIV